jgi:protein-tyrosine phosphatase
MRIGSAILFVDRTNTWGSPLASALFSHHAARLGLDIASSSVGLSRESTGEPAALEAIDLARDYGLDLGDHLARQLRLQDLRRYSHIVAIDRETLGVLKAMVPAGAELSLLFDHTDDEFAACACDLATGGMVDAQAARAAIDSGVRGLVADLAAARLAALSRVEPTVSSFVRG